MATAAAMAAAAMAAAAQSDAPLIPNSSGLCLHFLLKVEAAAHSVDSIFQYTIHTQTLIKDEWQTFLISCWDLYYDRNAAEANSSAR